MYISCSYLALPLNSQYFFSIYANEKMLGLDPGRDIVVYLQSACWPGNLRQ